MQGGDAFQMEDETYFPVEAMEGETARETLRFIGFVDDLIRSMKYRKNDKTLADWKNYLLEEVLQRFVFVRNENDREFKYVLNKLSILDEIAAAFSEKIPFEVFKKALNDLLFSETRSGEFITGAVTFSTMIPMRSIPFRVIAVLGLDNKKFPRTHVEPAFNLLSIQPRRGDRNIKDNDKHLFLETLLATRDHLYLSYRGNDIKDTNPLPPSLLIDELVGYIENSYTGEKKEVRDELVTKHPLHGFSPKYNTDHHLYSYDEVKTDDMARTGRSAEKGFEEDADTVTLDELIRFYRNPFKWYYNQILQVYYDEPEVLLPENELFELDNLQTYQLKHKLITCPDGYSIDGMIEKGKRTGELPLGNMSQVVFDRAQESVQSIREIFGRLTAGLDETAFSFALSMDGTRLNAQVDSVYGGVLIAFSLSDSDKKEPSRKYILEAWIKHLALAAAGTPKDTLFIWKHGEMVERIPGDMLSREEALTRLSLLVELYQKGRQQILPFDPAVSFNLVYKSTEVGKAFQYLKAIGETGFNKDYFDPYYQREIRQGFFDENNEKYTSRLDLFIAAAEAVWSPLRDHQSLFK
jgi:exodeoxyribonuclease V gamma subunit